MGRQPHKAMDQAAPESQPRARRLSPERASSSAASGLSAPGPLSQGVGKARIRVLCVNDHAILIEGMRARIQAEPDFEFVGMLASAEGLEEAVRRLEADLVLMDIEMRGRDPFEACAELLRVHPKVRVAFLSAHVRDHYLTAAAKAGALGFFSKLDEPALILAGIRKVAKGESTLGPIAAGRAVADVGAGGVSARCRLATLSERELSVLRMIGQGKTRAQIAAALSRSPKTIDGHRERIMGKLDIHSAPELVRYAIREGLTEA